MSESRRSTSHTKDRTGLRYGRLEVIRRVTSAPGIVWLCRCDCGRWPEVSSDALAHRRSCGCLKVEAAKAREKALAATRQVQYYPLDPHKMAAACRKLAQDLRQEHAMGWPPVPVSSNGNNKWMALPRDEAADSMDAQAERWEQEATTGEKNLIDREKIGW